MGETLKRLAQGQLGTSAVALYTPAAGVTAIVRSLRLVNPTATTSWIELWDGGSTNVNAIIPRRTLYGYESAEFDGVLVLEPTVGLFGAAQVATTITYTAYGIELAADE